MTRRSVAATAVAVLLLLGIYRASSDPAYPTNGPLTATAPIRITLPLAEGEVATWGMPLSVNLPTTIVLRKVEPLDVVGLDIVGIAACHSPPSPAPDGSWISCGGTGLGWQAPAGEMAPVDGTSVPPGPPGVGILVGVRRTSGAGVSAFTGLRIIYDVGSRRFEVKQPWSLVVRDPGAVPGAVPQESGRASAPLGRDAKPSS